MNEPPERLGRTTDVSYPFGIIGAALMNSIGVTLATLFLYMIGTVLGLMAGSGSWDFGWFSNFGLLILLVVPYVLFASASNLVSAFCTLGVLLLWFVGMYSETLKGRLTLLGVVLLLAFIGGWCVGSK